MRVRGGHELGVGLAETLDDDPRQAVADEEQAEDPTRPPQGAGGQTSWVTVITTGLGSVSP